MSAPTFVVGTGRCGTTMLSNMLRDHPDILSLSEFFSFVSDFGSQTDKAFASGAVSGAQFWECVGGILPYINFALRYGASPETLYPADAAGARFSSLTGVPAILHATLPHITEDCDELFQVLGDEIESWPSATMGEHYGRLFGLLRDRFDKRIWVERSGSIFFMVPHILAMFPDARFIHIVRDGRDVALSMQQHEAFRLGVVMNAMLKPLLGVNPIESVDRTHIERVPEEWRVFLPERFDVDAFRAFPVPLEICGVFWRQQIEHGLNMLRPLPEDRLLTLRYEGFFTAPEQQLDALAAFLGPEFLDPAWSKRCAAKVHKPRSSWRDLPADTAAVLTAACARGFDCLGQVGVHYDI